MSTRLTFAAVSLATVLLVVAACGDSASPADDGSGGEAAGAGAGNGSLAGAAGGAGEPSGPGGLGGAGPEGGSSSAAGDSAGGTVSDPLPLLPLVTGHVSKFVFTPIDAAQPMLDTCESPTTQVQTKLTLEDHTGPLYLSFCAPSAFLIEGEGEDLTAHEVKDGAIVPPEVAYMRSPVASGETWDSGRGDSYTWQQVTEPLVTPAGTFNDCWHRQGTSNRITYCRGVGVVQALAPYANYQLDLVEKNF